MPVTRHISSVLSPPTVIWIIVSERMNEHWEKNRGLHNIDYVLYTVAWCYLTKDSERGGEIHKFQQIVLL
jgi:hypothetical protein